MNILRSASAVVFVLSISISAFSQDPTAPGDSSLVANPVPQTTGLPSPVVVSPAVQMIGDFKDSDVKFNLNELVDILRDRRHEGWVLAAYPDPRTAQPLIGAGFSLDLPERQHPQTDVLNPHPFLEPSSAELWKAAGFEASRLDEILSVFYQRRKQWNKRKWRRQLYSLPAQITDEDATQLVRVGAIQAIYNARAYCRNYDQLSGSQQMAMAQLVYQMGVNLQHFTNFLDAINSDTQVAPAPQMVEVSATTSAADGDAPASVSGNQSLEYWQSVQKSLMGSQWAHKYRTRAIAVIAMLDPAYGDDPTAAEQRVSTVLRPAVVRRRHGHAAATTRQVAASKHRQHSDRRSKTRTRTGDRA